MPGGKIFIVAGVFNEVPTPWCMSSLTNLKSFPINISEMKRLKYKLHAVRLASHTLFSGKEKDEIASCFGMYIICRFR